MADWKPSQASDERSSSVADDILREEGLEANEADNEMPAQLEKVQSRKSEINPLAEPPDGGLNAWLKVLGCFLIYSNIW